MKAAHAKLTYRSQADIDSALTAGGSPVTFSVLIAGKPAKTGYTELGAQIEVDSHFRVFGSAGLVLNAANEIVYAVA